MAIGPWLVLHILNFTGRHSEVGIKVKYETDCIDRQIHLLVEESLRSSEKVQTAVNNGHAVVVHFSKSCLSRQSLKSIQEELGLPTLCPILGTSNRWFYKMTSTERLLAIKVPVEVYLSRQDNEFDLFLADEDWELMAEYLKLVKPFSILSQVPRG